MSKFPDLVAGALNELSDIGQAIDPLEVQAAIDQIASAKTILLYGCGREALQIRGFAMRLFHLGRSVAMVADMTAPPLGPGDLFIASAGPGELSTVTALMRVAKSAGARILFITGEPGCEAAKMADQVLTIPAQTMARDQGAESTSVLPMGSVYEGAMFVLFEAMILILKDQLGVTTDDMRANHTNME